MGLIGALNTLLTANTQQFDKKMNDSAKRTANATAKMAQSFDQLKTVALTFGAAFVGGKVLGGLYSMASAQAETIDKSGELASRLGVTTEALTSLREATKYTGSDTAALDDSLGKLNVALAQAQTGAGPAYDALVKLGLSAQDLASMKTDQAFLTISDKFKTLPAASDKAAVAMAFFSDSGLKMINTLDAGSSKIKQLQEESKKFGNVFTDGDSLMVSNARDTISRITGIFTGFANVLAVEVAPYITALGEYFLGFANEGYNATAVVRGGLKFLATAIGVVVDVVHTAKLAWVGLGAGATKILAVVTDGVWYLAKAIDKVTSYLPGFETKFADTVGAVSQDLHELASNQFADLQKQLMAEPPSNGIAKFFEDISAAAEKTKVDVNKTAAAVKTASGAMDNKELTAKKNFKTWVINLRESLQSPLEKYKEETDKLAVALQTGGIDKKQYAKARQLKLNEYLDATGQKETKFAGALELGSKEARSAILEATQGNQNDPLRQQLQTAKSILEQQTMQTTLTSELVRLFRDKQKEETDFDF